MLFNSKEELLSLYNAVNGTHYDNVDDLEINTLEEGVFMKMKNDISFVLGYEMTLIEHQSTKCGNMPLRFLFYVTKLIAGYINMQDLYESKTIKIPTPRFVVFYNGEVQIEDKVIVKLSDQFEKKVDNPELELTATIININENCNPDIMDACKTLKDYSIFVARIRKYVKEMKIDEAVSRAIDECIAEDVLTDFLRKNRAEVQEMSVFEYNEELHLKNVHRDGYEEGHEDGREEAKAEYEEIVAEKDEIISEKDEIISEKDAKIAELEGKLKALTGAKE